MAESVECFKMMLSFAEGRDQLIYQNSQCDGETSIEILFPSPLPDDF